MLNQTCPVMGLSGRTALKQHHSRFFLQSRFLTTEPPTRNTMLEKLSHEGGRKSLS